MAHARLLEIAVREFGSKGFEGASTRAIANAADMPMSSITYHFGGKAGLYLAAADYVAGEMHDLAPASGIAAIISANDPVEARLAIKAILGDLTRRFANRKTESWSQFIAHEQMKPTEVFERIYAGPLGRMLNSLVELIRIACRLSDRESAQIAALTLFGQVAVLRTARTTFTKLLGKDAVDPAVVAMIGYRVACNTDAILDALANEQWN